MTKIGLGLLYMWIGFNLVLALSIVVSMVLLNTNAPALTILFDSSSIKTITPNALKTINALAILMNATIVSLCSLSLVLIWKGLLKQKWVFITLGFCLGFVQLIGFVSDNYLENKNLLANGISTAILLSGLFLSINIFRTKKK